MLTARSAECLGEIKLLTRATGQLAQPDEVGELTAMQEAKIRLKRLGFMGLLPWSVRSPVLSVSSYSDHLVSYLPLSIVTKNG